MKKLLVIFLSILMFNISSAQTGWGYVNYTSYKTHGGVGSQTQYNAFANTAADFDVMFNTANSNTTITHTGETQIVNLYNGSSQVPRWNNDYFGYKFEFFFVPQQTGLYYFGINSDDASDLFVDGVSLVTYYGGHGASSWQVVGKNMVAGQRYRMVYRGQEFGGGEAFYFMWYRPVGGWGYWANEVTNVGLVPNKQARANFKWNSNLNATTFSASSLPLSSNGSVDITNVLDSNKIANGNKGTIVAGQVEWSYMNVWNGTTYIYIDGRTLNGVQPADVKEVKVLDLYDGPITFYSWDGTWAVYSLPVSVPKLTDGTSTYNSYIRNGGGYYAFACDISFSSALKYKPQSITLTTTNNLTTLYNSIVTVSDVWLAFKEVSNIGLFGNQSGNEFTRGIQYRNSDVNDDGYVNELDSYLLLQHLIGTKPLVDTFNLNKTLRIIPQSKYDSIGKSNWNTFSNPLGSSYDFDINTGKSIDTLNLAIAWKGDVNLSHSTPATLNNLTSMSVRTMSVSNEINGTIMTEIIGDSVYAYITIDPLIQELVGTQFQLNYDNTLLKFNNVTFKTKGSPNNYATDKGDYINLGSLITDGGTLDNTTEYKISFTPKTKLDNILGLISVGLTDAVNKSGKTLKIIMK